MAVSVQFFADLRDQVGCDGAVVVIGEVATVADVWLQAAGGRPLPHQTRAEINHHRCSFSQSVESGDEVAFFPAAAGEV